MQPALHLSIRGRPQCCRKRKEIESKTTAEKRLYVDTLITASTDACYRREYKDCLESHSLQFINDLQCLPLVWTHMEQNPHKNPILAMAPMVSLRVQKLVETHQLQCDGSLLGLEPVGEETFFGEHLGRRKSSHRKERRGNGWLCQRWQI